MVDLHDNDDVTKNIDDDEDEDDCHNVALSNEDVRGYDDDGEYVDDDYISCQWRYEQMGFDGDDNNHQNVDDHSQNVDNNKNVDNESSLTSSTEYVVIRESDNDDDDEDDDAGRRKIEDENDGEVVGEELIEIHDFSISHTSAMLNHKDHKSTQTEIVRKDSASQTEAASCKHFENISCDDYDFFNNNNNRNYMYKNKFGEGFKVNNLYNNNIKYRGHLNNNNHRNSDHKNNDNNKHGGGSMGGGMKESWSEAFKGGWVRL